MAVEATNFSNLFPQERDLMNWRSVICAYNERMCFNDEVDCDSMRKRCRESVDVGEDFPASNIPFDLPQIQQQYQSEIDTIISQHNKRMKLELQKRQKQQTDLLTSTIRESVVNKLKEKDDQIHTMLKLNMILQDKAKNLYIENQLWRNVAQANEATTIFLRTNLEHALAERINASLLEEESCCDNSDIFYDNDYGKSRHCERRCKQCGKREACVLLLPCRHLCLCKDCGSGHHQPQACPVCNSSMNSTLHVNM